MDRSQPKKGERQEEWLPWGMLLLLAPCFPQARQGGRGLLRALLWHRAMGASVPPTAARAASPDSLMGL